MKALTLWRPWPYSIFRLGKDIENRTWKPHADIIGQRIALHAGKKWDEDGARFIASAIAGDTVDGWRSILEKLRAEWYPPMSIVGTVVVTGHFRFGEMFEKTDSPWAFGPYCWRLYDTIEFPEPIPCAGSMGLWEVPHSIRYDLRWLEPQTHEEAVLCR